MLRLEAYLDVLRLNGRFWVLTFDARYDNIWVSGEGNEGKPHHTERI